MREDQLIYGLKSGDNAAFKVLVENYRQKVVSMCMGYTGDYDAALDLAQDVFVEVHRSVKNFRGDSKISTWIFRIAVNKSLNWVRDNKKHKQAKSIERFFGKEDGKNENLQIQDQKTKDSSEILENAEDGIIIRRAIDSLPENQRTAFILNKIDGFSYKKTAEIMKMSLPAVEALIHRARKSLQKELVSVYKGL